MAGRLARWQASLPPTGPAMQASCQRLRPHLGPVLFQFPTNFRTTSGKGERATSNIERLSRLGQVGLGQALLTAAMHAPLSCAAAGCCAMLFMLASAVDWHCTGSLHF